MNRSGLMYFVLMLLAGNLTYLIATIGLATILDLSVIDVFSGPLSEGANSLITAWKGVGALLGLVDIVTFVGFISSAMDGR